MSAPSIAAACAVALVVSLIVSIVIGAMASLVPDRPGAEHPITTLGHRAINWAAGIGVVCVAIVIVMEHLP